MFIKRPLMGESASTSTAGGSSGTASTAGGSTGTGGSSTAAGGGNSSASPWYSGLPAEEKGFVETKGYKDLADAVRSHRNLESLLGAPKERLLKLPEKADDADGWNGVYTKLGKPEKPDGYDPKTFGKGTSETDAKWLQDTFHSLNLTKAQGETLAQKWGEKMAGVNTALSEARVAESNQQLEKLKQEWGQAFEEKTKIANQVAAQAGITNQQYEQGEAALGVDGWAKFLEGVASKFQISFNEAGFHRGETGGGSNSLTPSMAQEKLNRLQGDSEWVKRFMNGDAVARKEMDDIHKALYPGMTDH